MTDVELIIDSILNSAKYRAVSADLVCRVVEREWSHRKDRKAAEQTARNSLHQMVGAYSEGKINFRKAAEEFTAPGVDHGDLCKKWMRCHSSTRERLPILESFTEKCFGTLGPVSSVLDIACGLNPLTAPWMPLEPGADYYACDIDSEMMQFLGNTLPTLGVNCVAESIDVVQNIPDVEVDIVLILKFLSLLDQEDRSLALPFLQKLRAPRILVSYPTRSLGGRRKGMAQNYAERFHEIIEGQPWEVSQFEFDNELCFLIQR